MRSHNEATAAQLGQVGSKFDCFNNKFVRMRTTAPCPTNRQPPVVARMSGNCRRRKQMPLGIAHILAEPCNCWHCAIFNGGGTFKGPLSHMHTNLTLQSHVHDGGKTWLDPAQTRTHFRMGWGEGMAACLGVGQGPGPARPVHFSFLICPKACPCLDWMQPGSPQS